MTGVARTYLAALAPALLLLVVAGAQPAPAAANRHRADPWAPYSYCWRYAGRSYNFGYYALGLSSYEAGIPASSPYTPLPTCRVTSRNPGDKPVNRIDTARPFVYTNARVGVYRLRPAAQDRRHRAWPVYDSVGKIVFWVTTTNVKPTRVMWRFWSADWGGPGSSRGRLLATRRLSTVDPGLRVQGRACMTSASMRHGFYAVQFPTLVSALPGYTRAAIGRPSAWGFIATSALDFNGISSWDVARLQRAHRHDSVLTSCGRRRPLARDTRSVRFHLSRTPFAVHEDHYLGDSSWTRCNPDDPTGRIGDEGQCSSYATYSSVPGLNLRVVASATTGVSGGGLAEALLPDWMAFRAIRYIDYCDPNVPRVETHTESVLLFGRNAQGAIQQAAWNRAGNAFWVFGKFRVGGRTRWVYGWTPEPCSRLPELRNLMATKAHRDRGDD